MDTITEINCSSCGQRVPIDRYSCPYCRTEIKSYWFEDQGAIKRAILFSEHGLDYLLIDGKKLSVRNLNEIPYALHPCFPTAKDSNALNNPYATFGKLAARLILGRPLAKALLGEPPGSDPPLPSKWDSWLE